MLSLQLLILVVLLPLHRVDRVGPYLQLLLPDAPFPIALPQLAVPLPQLAVPLPAGALIPDELDRPELQQQLRRAPAPKLVVSVLLQPWQAGNPSNW